MLQVDHFLSVYVVKNNVRSRLSCSLRQCRSTTSWAGSGTGWTLFSHPSPAYGRFHVKSPGKKEGNFFRLFLPKYEYINVFYANRAIFRQVHPFMANLWPFLEKSTFSNANIKKKTFTDFCWPYRAQIKSYTEHKPIFDNFFCYFLNLVLFLAILAILAIFTILAVTAAHQIQTALHICHIKF